MGENRFDGFDGNWTWLPVELAEDYEVMANEEQHQEEDNWTKQNLYINNKSTEK